MNNSSEKIRIRDLIAFILGSALYAWSLINVNIPNNLAEGGISGITLILRALFGLNPAYTTLILNIPLLIIGYKLLGRRSIIYTLFGTISLSFWLWFWQIVPMNPPLHHDALIAAIIAGILGGLGLGIIMRFGGTTGGSDVIALVLERKLNLPMGRTIFALDASVLVLSLVYLDIVHMMYTLIMAFVFAQVLNFTQKDGYSARAFLIFSAKSVEISDAIMAKLERGTSLFDAQGGYTKNQQQVVYTVVDPSEVSTMYELIKEIDPSAFITVSDTSETLGEGFSFSKPDKSLWKKIMG
ncbi:hypothetical protein FC70_GL001173 [Paucilactobacillus oligofermentans DSM 15707 = LMG 22743]|uniref:DUF2179 domain-containing protein n=1 Tax=Paucilactobacillus oligofermentans DSM 15707 = LMG 22743 TaxID=1423778 RepID=A0A0R1RK27_9LACO|nr:YitT family protein [Paucilactobacillus oligofermentans]KRL55572.1 hypothetical protein FC70_GL001173 [Paucilactobacillus oligofermentans DSM 15707 = LMG 22743]CUS25440.1 UPF0750 membrane protein YpjC [Paucilactobacillus oligofermentans DSM 15707 = LMG 22743]